jgi:hypothetical protein
MKTTMELPDSLFRRVKTSASLRGRTMKEFITEALISALATESGRSGRESGWRAVYGKASRKDVQVVDRVIKEEFERVNPEDWK